jgi:hypothetical protein
MRRSKKPIAIPDLSTLKIKPHWWLELHKPIPIIGRKMPYGIQAQVEHDGMQYEGMLYPVTKEDTNEHTFNIVTQGIDRQ